MTRNLVLGLLLLVIAATTLTACGGPPQRYQMPVYQPYLAPQTPVAAAPEPPAPAQRRALVLSSVSPASEIGAQRTLMVEREEYIPQQQILARMGTFVRYTGSGSASATHGPTSFSFSLTPLDVSSSGQRVSSNPLALGLSIRNTANAGLIIDWSAVNIIASGKAHPVTHRGVRMVDRSAPMAPSTIPPTASLEDFVYPREALNFVAGYGRYSSSSWYGGNFFEGMKPGDSFTLYLPVKRGTDTTEYQFVFEVRDQK